MILSFKNGGTLAMPGKGNPKIEFRYYKMPEDVPFLALFGDKWIQNYGRDIDFLHFHNYLEIGYCYDGTGTLVIGSEEFRYEGGYFSVIPQNCPHTTNSDPDTVSSWEFLFLDIDTLLKHACQTSGTKRIAQTVSRINSRAYLRPEKERPKIGQMIRAIFNIMRRKEEFYLEEAQAEASILLMNLARENKVGRFSEKMPLKEAVPIAQALDHISMHYMEPLKISELAESCHISESHFRKIFSSYMNMGPMEYINLVRVQTACDLLKRTDDFVTDVANKCGYPTFSTFSRNFKKIMGVSPNEWRKRPDNYEQQLLKSQIHSEKGW